MLRTIALAAVLVVACASLAMAESPRPAYRMGTLPQAGPVVVGAGNVFISGQMGTGTPQHEYNNWPANLWEIAQGTVAAPVTTAGSTIRISRVESMDKSSCTNNAADTECDSALAVYSLSSSSQNMTSSALNVAATGSTTTVNADVQGANIHGRILAPGVGIATGAYIEGRRDTDTARVLGAEITAWNRTLTDCANSISGISACDALWLTPRGSTSPTIESSAVQIGLSGDHNSIWKYGISINQLSVDATGMSFNDQSNSGTSLNVAGSHTYALITQPSSGAVGFGIAAPTDFEVNMPATFDRVVNINGPVLGANVLTINSPDSNNGVAIVNSDDDTTRSDFSFYKNRAGTIVHTADTLGTMTFWGYDGASYNRAANIQVTATGTPSAGVIPGQIEFDTANSSGVMTKALTIANNQHILLASVPTSCSGQPTGTVAALTGVLNLCP